MADEGLVAVIAAALRSYDPQTSAARATAERVADDVEEYLYEGSQEQGA